MQPAELFDVWAPPAAVWSRWAKPVLFAEMSAVPPVDLAADVLPSLNLRTDPKAALVLDLPSADSVKAGLTLAAAGFRPIPLFNGNRGPGVLNVGGAAVVDNDRILTWLVRGAAILGEHHLPLDAPPAFLLDSKRRPQLAPAPGRFDNRWIVFPQDFPSGNFLKAHGIEKAVLVQEGILQPPQEDLAHVLLRWQEGGIPVFITTPANVSEPQPLIVKRPSHFRSLCYGVLAAIGLRRNSAGGFGSVVPQPSSGG